MSYDNKAYRYYVLFLLTIGYVFSFIDRQILAILQEPIKVELGLSDSQLGMLSGLAFAAFYVVFGLPVARWADRGVRRSIVSWAVGIWSLMTVLCGYASSFIYLLMARIGVAIGEAGGGPPSHSMISDIFSPKQRATALGTYSLGVNIGILFGFLMGGWLNQMYGWRMTFLIVGIPGILLALLMRFTIVEPERGFSEKTTKSSIEEDIPSIAQVIQRLWSLRAFRHLALASGLTAFAGYSVANWMPSFLVRTHQMSSAEIGTVLALIAGLGGGIGTFLGSYLADRFGERDSRWFAWIPALGLGAVLPLAAATFWVDNTTLALVLHVIPACAATIYLAPAIAVTHHLVDNRMRALSSAVLFFVLNVVGLGLGPVSVGILSDLLRESLGQDSLRYALLFLCTTAQAWAVFHFYKAGIHLKTELVHKAPE